MTGRGPKPRFEVRHPPPQKTRESHTAFERFAAESIGPITQEVGVPGPPRTTIVSVHNTLTAG
jgi:hypothetical protein